MTWERGMVLVIVTLLYTVLGCYGATNWDQFRLHPEHIPYFFRSNPKFRIQCGQEDSCPFKWAISMKKCWGYELNCLESERMKTPVCDADSQGLSTNLTVRVDMFWKQADFGFVKEKRLQLKTFCPGYSRRDSSFDCTKYLRYCRGQNFYMDFREGNRTGYVGFPFKTFPTGGKCTVNKEALSAEGQYPDLFDSWFVELEKYSSLSFYPADDFNQCDFFMTGNPTFILKFVPEISMYNSLCNFFNLYITQHLVNDFSTAFNIILLDTGYTIFNDFYGKYWAVFTEFPIQPLSIYIGKRVCMRDAIFTSLPRVGDGIIHNMSLVSGCNGSSLVRAFSQHILFRISIPQEGPIQSSIRVTLMSTTARFKNILNHNELVSGLITVEEFQVKTSEFNRSIGFQDQLKISQNSDILIGINNDALTHVVYQPDWAVLFEIYHCNDKVTYINLAKLRGIRYMTWENKDKMVQEDMNGQPTTTFPEFSNYSFNKLEFMRLVLKAAHYVRTHPDFIKAWKAKYGIKSRRRP